MFLLVLRTFRHPQPLANDTECTNVPVTLEYEELNWFIELKTMLLIEAESD